MRKDREFLRDQTAVVEEFTSLPVLSVVMIGLTLFFVLIAQCYTAFEQQNFELNQVEKARYLSNKLISPASPFIINSGLIDRDRLDSSEGKKYINSLQKSFGHSSINFSVLIRYNDDVISIPDVPPDNSQFQVGYTAYHGLYIDDFHVVPCSITVIIWSDRI
jgi:hypothetical protein